MRITVMMALLLLAPVFCLAASEPKPTKSEYLLSTGAGFTLAEGEGARYAMDYVVRKKLPGQIFAVAIFENPESPGLLLRSELTISIEAKEISFQSPAFHSITNDQRYRVQLMLYLDAEHTKLLAEHDQDVRFKMPVGLLEQLRKQYSLVVY